MTMKMIVLGAVAAVFFTLAAMPSAFAQTLHGAIAYSPNTGAYGYSYNYSTQKQAENEAMYNCDMRARDCVIATTFYNACGAVAAGRNGGWGADWGNTAYDAQENALAMCSNYDNGCQIVRWQCTD